MLDNTYYNLFISIYRYDYIFLSITIRVTISESIHNKF